MSSRFQIIVIAFILALIGLLTVWYKAMFLNIPLTPHTQKFYYTLTAQIDFQGEKAPATLSMTLPQSQNGIHIISQETETADFGYTISKTKEGERGVWSKRLVEGEQTIFYKTTLSIEPYFNAPSSSILLPNEEETQNTFMVWEDVQRKAVMDLIQKVQTYSSNNITFMAKLIDELNAKEPKESVKVLLSIKDETKISLIGKILTYQKIPFRKIKGILLEDNLKNRKLTEMIETERSDGTSAYFDFEKGNIVKPDNFFIWQRGNEPLFVVEGVSKAKLRFSVIQTLAPVAESIKDHIYGEDSAFLNFSLYSLPSSEQNAFKQILLIPIGVLIVVILRILVGIRTMGTFMPVLFALTFLQTTLLNGLIMFFVIVFSGLFIRFYLSRLHLLLVARISAVIIVVIGIMSVMSILSYKLELTEALSVTFFPMIILSWTIERMSILWEEEGGHEVLVQGSGSLIVAVLTYFAMKNEYVAYLFFNFPEMLLVVLAMVIIIGRYTGYRLSELMRFTPVGR